MARDIDVMVLPSTVPEAPPRFLVSTNGFWRDLGAANKLADLSKLRTNIDDQLRADMDALDPQVGGTIAFSNYYSLIYEPLLPEALCRMLKETKPDNEGDPPPVLRLHIDPSLDWIPWEVAHDGDEFLGLRFRIARLPIVPRQAGAATGKSRDASRRSTTSLGSSSSMPRWCLAGRRRSLSTARRVSTKNVSQHRRSASAFHVCAMSRTRR